MGKFPKRELHCSICKSSFFSYKQFGKDSLSHRSHRSKNKKCLEEQRRLRKEHLEAGNADDLNFEVDSNVDFDEIENDSTWIR